MARMLASKPSHVGSSPAPAADRFDDLYALPVGPRVFMSAVWVVQLRPERRYDGGSHSGNCTGL